MLTDIFARRYANYPIWTQYTENEPRLLQQCIGVAKARGCERARPRTCSSWAAR